jgi:hypothetical protein
MEKKESKISWMSAYLILSAALAIDLIEFGLAWIGIGLVINPFITFAADWSFFWIFYFLGVSVTGPRYLFTFLFGDAIEFFADGIFPLLLTIQQLIIILFVWGEEKLEEVAPGVAETVKKVSSAVPEKI